ncbi:ABC-three component system middle component 6 [Aliivibrio fischeri]|uniref:ABC-three component system middle component 6 n=1 Tax=Aliivibrio fischeri TaxID=668 RepID=UPI00354D9806
MILPTKHLSPDRALISIASDVLNFIDNRATVSSIWEELQLKQKKECRVGEVPYDWFILSLDLLFIMGIIEERSGFIIKVKNNVK